MQKIQDKICWRTGAWNNYVDTRRLQWYSIIIGQWLDWCIRQSRGVVAVSAPSMPSFMVPNAVERTRGATGDGWVTSVVASCIWSI